MSYINLVKLLVVSSLLALASALAAAEVDFKREMEQLGAAPASKML